MPDTTGLLRHTVATLAYRAGKTLRGAPPEFANFRPAAGSRTAGEILAHMGDLIDWAISLAEGRQEWHNSSVLSWSEGTARFFTALEAFDHVAAGASADSAEHLFQGPIAGS